MDLSRKLKQHGGWAAGAVVLTLLVQQRMDTPLSTWGVLVVAWVLFTIAFRQTFSRRGLHVGIFAVACGALLAGFQIYTAPTKTVYRLTAAALWDPPTRRLPDGRLVTPVNIVLLNASEPSAPLHDLVGTITVGRSHYVGSSKPVIGGVHLVSRY